MSVRRTLPTRADGRADDRFKRTAKPKVPAKLEAADVSDLTGKTASELKEIAECAALRALIGQVRKPTRHATAVTSAARSLLDFSSAKPAQAIDLNAKVSVKSASQTLRDRRAARLHNQNQ